MRLSLIYLHVSDASLTSHGELFLAVTVRLAREQIETSSSYLISRYTGAILSGVRNAEQVVRSGSINSRFHVLGLRSCALAAWLGVRMSTAPLKRYSPIHNTIMRADKSLGTHTLPSLRRSSSCFRRRRHIRMDV